MKRIAAIAIIVLCLLALPAAAAILEVTVSGTVAGLDRQNNTITIAHPARYGCTYPPAGDPVCSFTPMEELALAGSVPADSALSVFKTDDPVVATSLGGAGGQWIALAKLAGPADNRTVVDIVGDPESIPVPLADFYVLELAAEPDCTACTGTVCTASSVNVKVLDGCTLVQAGDLRQGSAMTYNGRNDGSSVSVTLVKGQASASSCAGRTVGMTGPQPVSVFLVHIVPPIGFATSSPQETAVPSATPELVTMPPEARPTPTKAGMLPFAAIGAIGLVAALAIRRR